MNPLLDPLNITTPLAEETIACLRAGQRVLINGRLLTARDAAHKRMTDALLRGEKLPVDLRSQVIYYVGPSPAPPQKAIGAAGPTTSSRMDPYTVPLLEQGLKGMIGKGYRTPEVLAALKTYKAVYFVTYGGAGALLAQRIKKARVLAYSDLGPEAIHEFMVEGFPAIVAADIYGGNIYP